MPGLDALKAVREQLAAQRVAAEQKAKQAAAEKAKLEAEKNVFRNAVQDAQPLPASNRAVLPQRKPVPFPVQTVLDEKAALNESLSDEFGVEQMLETDDALSFRREGIGPDVLKKLRRGHWVTQDELDLHGHRVEQAREELALFLKDAVKRGLRCVRVVHGKGLGSKDKQPVLKGKVRSWLTQKEEVIAFVAARPAEGGGGALVVLLRPTSA
ncbi:MAG: Smr/MutS family protein [Burkholderiaceae bacterium]